MKILPLIIILIFTSIVTSQETEDVYPIDDFFEDYFKLRKLNLILMFNDPESNGIIYTVDGLNQLEELNPKLIILHETFNSYEKITMQTWFKMDKALSLKEKFDLINNWSNPKYPASIFWDEKKEIYILSASMMLYTKTVSFRRIDDMYLGFIAALKDLDHTQKLKL